MEQFPPNLLTQTLKPPTSDPLAAAKLVKNATLKIYPGAPHGLTDTHK
ncbi:MAG: hypothetical protein KME32_31410 [Mojavia pulchra JT2-VF2]|uniref:Uncharacterized protein n=1 Tax=Mojavia pulchra JT2-VF2 TaxID=287848 RepID=A0A951Q6F5_9NOST|nr:hypothetical protein [Mojavia pulchra JT2-VF2]